MEVSAIDKGRNFYRGLNQHGRRPLHRTRLRLTAPNYAGGPSVRNRGGHCRAGWFDSQLRTINADLTS